MWKVSAEAILLSFSISVLGGPILIPFLHRLKIGQMVREDGPQTHLKKSGTPTMGGILIMIAVVITSLVFVEEYPKIAPVLFLTVGLGMVGFVDDYIKIVCRRSEGLTPLQKLLGQFLVTGMFALYLTEFTSLNLAMKIPGLAGSYLDLGWLNIPMLFFVVLGCANGVNFTDGLDGLAGSVTLMVAVFFSVVAFGTHAEIEPITCAVVGALLGFLLFNVHPAEVFMGDTGSLALGGFVAGCCYILQMPLFLVIVGCIYLVEVLSVAAQVVFFKISRGKRLLKMAPLHHHFELCGWSETRIVELFTTVTALMCLLALAIL